MNRNEFLRVLERELMRLPHGEREAALRYYEEYLDDAGPENEERILRDLGAPDALARDILRESAEAERIQSEGGWSGVHSQATQGSTATERPLSGPVSPFRSIKTEVLNAGLSILHGSGYAVNIDYPDGYPPPTCELRDGTLYIIDKKRRFTFLQLGFNSWRGGRIQITVPYGTEFDRFELKTTNGGITVPALTLNSIKADTVNGGIKMSGVQADQFEADSVNGSITVESCNAKRQCTCSSVNGSVRINGDIRGEVKYKTVNGSIRVESPLSQTDFNFRLSTVSGSVRINGEKMRKSTTIQLGAPNTIHASTVNGSIGFEFRR